MSTASPLADWFAPWLASVVSGSHEATPEAPSLHENETVTGVLFHPFAFGAGLTDPTIEGAVASKSKGSDGSTAE